MSVQTTRARKRWKRAHLKRANRTPGPLGRVVEWVKRRVMRFFQRLLVAYWRRRDPVAVQPRPMTTSLADNVQSTMNLVMPLLDPTAVGRARAVEAVSGAVDELLSGLNAVGTVHFARFDVVDGNLCMFSVYDGDFTSYIRDFIGLFGNVFDALMGIVADPPPLPCERYPEAFIEWVHRHDALQLSRDITTMLPGLTDLRTLPRQVILAVDANPNIQLGIYRGYPGSSVGQIRDALGVGW